MNISLLTDSQLLRENTTAEAHVFAVGGACAIDGDAVTLFAGVDAGSGTRNGCENKRIPFLLYFGSRTLYTFWATAFAIVFEKADVLHIYGNKSAKFIWLARLLRSRLVIVVTLFDTDFAKGASTTSAVIGVIYTKLITKFANEIIATQKSVQNELLLNQGFLASWIPNGVSVKRSATNDVVLEPLGVRSGSYVVYSVEGVNEASDAQEVVHKIEATFGEMNAKQVRLVIFAKREQKIVAQLESTSVVESPSLDVRKALFTGARAVVFSSKKQTHLLTSVLEAMSYGKTVVAPEAFVIREIMQGFGVPYPVADWSACKTAIEAVLADEMLAASIGHSARSYIEENYRWEATAQLVQELYHHHYLFRKGILALH